MVKGRSRKVPASSFPKRQYGSAAPNISGRNAPGCRIPFHLSLVVSADCTEYGLTGEEFTVNAAGQSYISYADYAIAVVNEAEQAAHVGERFSVYAK